MEGGAEVTPDAQRIAIAEACGWTEVSDWGEGGINGKHPTEPWVEVIPDYLNDLNAMNDALITMSDDQWARYVKILSGETAEESLLPTYYWQLEDVLDILQATNSTQAQAFLIAIDKWKEARK
jgi:hypothetical protein